MTSVATENQLIHSHVTGTIVDTTGVEQPPQSPEAAMALAPLTIQVPSDPNAPRPVVVTPSANFPTAQQLRDGADITVGMVNAALVSFLEDDPELAWSWHNALSQSIRDQGVDAYKANRGAAAFLALYTGGKVDMTKNEHYINLIKSYDKQLAAMGIEEAKATLRAANQGPIEIEDATPGA